MKFRKIEGNVNHSSLERLDTLPTPKTITVEEWYDDYYVPGIYFDTRYDRRILWALKQILDLHDSGLRNFLINPLIYADVESCYDFAVKTNSIKDKLKIYLDTKGITYKMPKRYLILIRR